jgi:hypothetical protein
MTDTTTGGTGATNPVEDGNHGAQDVHDGRSDQLEAEAHAARLDMLTDPLGLLAEALRQAQEADNNAKRLAAQWLLEDSTAYVFHKLEFADTLARIADVASKISPSLHLPQDIGDDAYTQFEAPQDEYEPQAVQGVRFEAVLKGKYLGLVAHREWLHVHGVGFVDISGFDQQTDPGGHSYRTAGRIVSATPEHVLCIGDGGRSLTLPRSAVQETPEDQR